MPSVLQNASPGEIGKWLESNSSPLSRAPLFIRYKCGFVPLGVFPAMIANLAGNSSLELIVKDIRKNRVQFQMFDGDCEVITLLFQPKYFAVHLTRSPHAQTPTHEACRAVRGLVESTLKTVSSGMNYSFGAEYQLSFECLSHPGREHLCTVESTPCYMFCRGNMDNPQKVQMQNEHLVWFKPCSPNARSPNYDSYVSTLPASALPHLELQLDWDHEGVESDLMEIAHHMLQWEEKLCSHLGLTAVDIHDIEAKYMDKPELQRREALRIWRNNQESRDTYGKLLELFVKAGHAACAKALCEVLRKKDHPPPG